MKYTDWITNTYKQHNEDACGICSNAAWVMDGALPLRTVHLTDAPNDVVWMVDWWSRYLNATLSNTTDSLHEVLTKGVESINSTFSKFADPLSLSKLDRASAAIGIVRQNKDVLECYVLGDVEIALRYKDGHIDIVTDTRIESLDAEVISMIANTKNRSQHIVFNGYIQAELDVLQRNRSSMNTPEGYAILEHDPTAIPRGIYKTVPASDIKDILLMSDGYTALYNKYSHCTLEALFNGVQSAGVDSMIPTLREIELMGFDTHSRLRKHDDATAVYISL